MRKKIFLVLILSFVVCAAAAMATGCIHVCDMSEKVTTSQYLKSAATCSTKAEYYYSCKCGEHGNKTFFYGSLEGHSFVNYVEHEEAECEKNATLIASCENGCGQTHVKEVPGTALEHQFVNYVSNNDATCKINATGTATCERGCGETDTKTLNDTKVAHRFIDYFNDNNATCMADATKTARCSYGCGETNTVSIPNTMIDHHVFHNYVYDNNATCMSDGTKTAYCIYDCGNSSTFDEPGTKLNHSYTNYVYNDDAECEVDGTETAHCDYECDNSHTRVKEGSALDHDYGEWTSNGDDTHSRVCSRDSAHVESSLCSGGTATETSKPICSTCGSEYGEVEGHVHNFIKMVAIARYRVSSSTCVSKAVYNYSCSCGEAGEDTFEFGGFGGHTFSNYTYNGDALCEVDGTETAQCDHGCGATDTRTKSESALDHNYGEWESNGNDTHSKVCSRNPSHIITADCVGGTATETSKAICSDCGGEHGSYLQHQHVFDKQVVHDDYKATDATCQDKATYYLSCSCGQNGYETTFEAGSYVNHEYGEYVSNNDATCQHEGTESAYCIYDCGRHIDRTEQGSIVDHLFTAYVFNNNATYDSDGTETAYCDYGCGASNTRTASGTQLNLPVYTSDDQIEIFAYSTPTHAKWDNYENNPEGITDKVYSDMAAAGFTGVQALREGYYKQGSSSLNTWHEYAATDALQVMQLCNKYGMKYMIRDWAFMGSFNIFYGAGNNGALWQSYFNRGGTIESGLNEMFSIPAVRAATNNSAYAGHNLWDEPDIPQMEKLIPVVRTYKQLVPHGDPYFNLLPCYATEEQLGGTYEEYIAYYCQNIAPMLGYISYDYYPYSVTKVSEKYLYNFQIVAEYAKRYDLEFRLYIQAGYFGGDSRECDGVGFYRHQMYTAMAYGVRYFIYFTYGYGMNDNGLVDTNLNPTAKYYYAKQANSEVHALEDVMLNFDWQGIMYKKVDSSNRAFNHLSGFSNVMSSHPRINSYTATKDTVIGCFKDGENRDGFMFVNYVDPSKNQTDNVTVKFNNAKKLIVYELGVRKVVDLPSSGEYSFSLSAGEGRFVIPIA